MTRTTLAALLAVCVLTGLPGAVARAEVTGGGPDESIGQAYGPIQQGVVYTGALGSPTDVDYLAFRVTYAGEPVHFTISNTLASCNLPDDINDGCPVYATLMDATNNQVGGDGSGAGTQGLTVWDPNGTIDWTFAQPGTYYLLLEGDTQPGGEPCYVVQLSPPPAPSGTTPPSPPAPPGTKPSPPVPRPAVRSITVPRHQRGDRVRSSVVLARAARVGETVYVLGRHRPRPVAGFGLRRLSAGVHRLAVRLPAAYRRALRRKHHLSLSVTITVVASGSRPQAYSRRVSLRRG